MFDAASALMVRSYLKDCARSSNTRLTVSRCGLSLLLRSGHIAEIQPIRYRLSLNLRLDGGWYVTAPRCASRKLAQSTAPSARPVASGSASPASRTNGHDNGQPRLRDSLCPLIRQRHLPKASMTLSTHRDSLADVSTNNCRQTATRALEEPWHLSRKELFHVPPGEGYKHVGHGV